MAGPTVLVVDEFVSFRESVCGMLHATPSRVVGQTSGGWDAVQMAKQLQPDLILHGLGLPKLHGLETAKRLRTLAPQANLCSSVRRLFPMGYEKPLAWVHPATFIRQIHQVTPARYRRGP